MYNFRDHPGRPPLLTSDEETALREKYGVKTRRQIGTLYHAEQVAKMLRGKNAELRAYFLDEAGGIRNTLIAAQVGMALRDHGESIAIKFAEWIRSEGETQAGKAENLLKIVSAYRRKLWETMY